MKSSNFEQILNHEIEIKNLKTQILEQFIEFANQKYREGNPVVSDEDYDFLYLQELKKRNPSHPFLLKVEPEGEGFSEEKILIPETMLSIDKAYSFEEIHKWADRILKSCKELSFDLNS